MRIDFIQGIITYPTSAGQQVFLAKIGPYISLQTANGRTDISVAHGSENYLFTEASDVNNAWGPLATNTDYWLYWDINLRTAARTFGFTTLEPTFGPIAPTGIPTQHWFNTDTSKMYVHQAGAWREVVRIFAAKVNNNTFTGLGIGISGKPFAGSQVNVFSPGIITGRIIVDNTGTPIRRDNGLFFTTEDEFFVNGSPANTIKLEANIINATANETIARYQVVKYVSFGRINLANYDDTQTTMLAMSMEDILLEHTGTLCVQGVITNPQWDWQIVGAELWVDGFGLLTEIDPHITDSIIHPVGKVPVARVLTQTSIFFDQGLGGKGDKGERGTAVPYASDTVTGISKLSLAAANINNPVVVGDNDPRLIPYTHPATHPATIITTDTYGFLNGLNTQVQLHQLVDRTLDSLGNVVVPSPSTNDYLKWNGTNWVNAVFPVVPSLLDDLSNVTVPSPSTNDYLKWNGTNWINTTFPNIPLTLDDLSNVTVPSPSTNDYLKWDGTDWINAPVNNQSITLSGDVIGTGTTAITTALSTTGVNPGTYNSVTVDSKGRITNGTIVNTLPYDLAFYIPSTPFDINTIVTGFLSPRIITIPIGAQNIAKCSTVATTTITVFSIKVQGSQVATVTFAIGSSTGVISFTAGPTISIIVGDVITVSTTGTIDGVIAGIGITLVGTSITS